MNITVTLAQLNGEDLETGDEIGIFDGDVCVAAGIVDGTITSDNYMELRASAQDADWPAGTGFTAGNEISYRFWDTSAGVQTTNTAGEVEVGIEITVSATYSQGEGVFSTLATSAITLSGTSPDCGSQITCWDGSCADSSDDCPTLAINDPYLLDEFTISQNYPNPFNPVTNIIYGLPGNTFVQMEVFDITGKKVQSLVNKFQTSGSYSVNWNASSESSGVYFVKMIAGKTISTKKIMLIK